MDIKTQELLMKTRKGATAAFETKQWSIVLTALGFDVAVTKERNTVTEVVVTSPLTHRPSQKTFAKERDYRRIQYYDLGRWLKDIGFDLVAESSRALGLPTPEAEKALKDLYVRDLTNTGTCPVCGGNFKREAGGGIHHHGFERPGDGMLHGSCFGVGYQPWELSPQGAQDYLDKAILPHLASARDGLRHLQSGRVTKLYDQKFKWEGSRQVRVSVDVTFESDAVRFTQLLKRAQDDAEADIRRTEATAAGFEARIQAWRLDDLPEIKHAGKFNKAS